MIEDEMIVEEVDHVIEVEETIGNIMMDTIVEVVDMMIGEGLILKFYQWKIRCKATVSKVVWVSWWSQFRMGQYREYAPLFTSFDLLWRGKNSKP